MGITILQLHKRSSYEFKYIQDKFSINLQNKTFAVADGTTQSFKSDVWADIITKAFTEKPEFKVEQIIDLFSKRVPEFKSHNYEFSANPAKASLEKAKQVKGGTATFLGVQFNDANSIDVIACGDTNLFLFNDKNKFTAFPFSDIESLDRNNNFINTEQLLLSKIDETYFKYEKIALEPNDILILATDALSRLILKNPKIINELLVLNNFDALLEFCQNFWDAKELQEDDITAVIIPVSNMDKVHIVEPPMNFLFPKEKEAIFTPTLANDQNQINNTDMEIEELRKQFNRVAHETQELQKKLKFHEMLLMLTFGLFMVIIFLLLYLDPINSNKSDSITEIEKVIVPPIKDTVKINSGNKQTQKISKQEAIKRQGILLKAGYKVKLDSIWGGQSQNKWNEYLNKKKNKK